MNPEIKAYKKWCADHSYDVLPGEREQIIKYRNAIRTRRNQERVTVIMGTIADFYRTHIGADNCCTGIDGMPEFIPRIIRSDIEPTETETGLFGVERGDGHTLAGTTPSARVERVPVEARVIRGDGQPLHDIGCLRLDEVTALPVAVTTTLAPAWFRPVYWPDRVPLGDAARHINVSPSSLLNAATRGKVLRNPDGTFHIKDVENWSVSRGQTAAA